ncbi:hypothetical protein AJ80_07312 [Polytolypa hystricis UAMH7299]|uniref:Mannosyltransferase n=1 Tax=Polytolypa hystricis (strain UAMH7299) TaxID=1447883 RepID=A0A2B7XPE5_POLH7|nr:hypothetical protein AJ80_07312 [Polytolypa hystricis UAMH7299]
MAPAREQPSAAQGHADGVSRTNPKAVPPPFYLPLNVAFYLCLLSNTLAAALAPIQDCDEVFNYWEPTHYLDHGYGLQTWEYSPEYSIRSWLYIAFHALISKSLSIFARSKTAQFYFVRVALAVICTACETRLYSSISRSLNPRIGILFLMVVLFSPGMFHASAALLPSSFAMYTSMMGLASFMDSRGGRNTPRVIMWFGIGAIVGWPFAGALVLPFVLEDVMVALASKSVLPTFFRLANGALRCLIILAIEVAVDSFFYRKLVIVPWNIVAYNVFGGSGKGPDIFGTEPWTFYIRNLLLNFNIWFVLALAVAPLLLLQALFRSQTTTKQTLVRSIAFVSPFYLWFAIFTFQPHKEERFMYPAYPFLALNAAIAFHIILSYIGSSNPKELVGRISPKVKFTVVTTCVLVAFNIGLLRTVGMVTAYNAPLKIFHPLQTPEVASRGNTLCIGKEWYRFPSSYFLPNNMRAKFIKSEFDGLLPGEFAERKSRQDPFPGTYMTPSGMNNRNEEDPDKYIDISQCAFLVDSYFEGDQESNLQPHYVLDHSNWEELSCSHFLDSSRTGLLARTLWTPNFPFIPSKLQRKWGRYCLLGRRSKASSDV